MVERIRQILQSRQLSPTQFADALGVARPIISHVLSGRNKPSLEVVQKIITAFPDLSLPWLLSGQGPMLAAATTSQPVAPAATAPSNAESASATPIRQQAKRSSARSVEAKVPAPAVPPTLPPTEAAAPPPVPPVSPSAPAPVTPVAPAPSAVPQLQSQGLNAQSAATTATPATTTEFQKAPQAQSAPAPSANSPDLLSAFAEPGKTIRRIVIFYHDGTFSAYQPEMPI
jgi:transcriptional regulator with XRE-family HTH domain